MEKCEAPKIEMVEYEISQQVSGQAKLVVAWRFTNPNNGMLYVLIAHPRPIVTGHHVILDHLASDNSDELYFNVVPGFEFIAIAPAETIERLLSCHLELPGSFETITIVGKFGYNGVPPNPDWERTKNWTQVAKWQQIGDSDPLSLRLKKSPGQVF
ncbi:MAG: hypothetical protein WAO00_01850 [Chthoniobacterales bacterium]